MQNIRHCQRPVKRWQTEEGVGTKGEVETTEVMMVEITGRMEIRSVTLVPLLHCSSMVWLGRPDGAFGGQFQHTHTHTPYLGLGCNKHGLGCHLHRISRV